MPIPDDTRAYVESLVRHFERPAFIDTDPISIPHGFDDPRDQEVIGLYAALLAWGQRRTVLNKMAELCERMRFRPYEFVRNFDPGRDAARLKGFKHRTFQPSDAFWLTRNLGTLLREHGRVEELFIRHLPPESALGDRPAEDYVGPAIQGFSASVMHAHPQTPRRLQKHLARPESGSACKRLNMFLRWMVRSGPVDLGIWPGIRPEQLMLPLDVHAGRQARRLGMLERSYNDWRACLELTENCRKLSPDDPARYDFAFFGLGIYGEPEGLSLDGSLSRHSEARTKH